MRLFQKIVVKPPQQQGSVAANRNKFLGEKLSA